MPVGGVGALKVFVHHGHVFSVVAFIYFNLSKHGFIVIIIIEVNL